MYLCFCCRLSKLVKGVHVQPLPTKHRISWIHIRSMMKCSRFTFRKRNWEYRLIVVVVVVIIVFVVYAVVSFKAKWEYGSKNREWVPLPSYGFPPLWWSAACRLTLRHEVSNYRYKKNLDEDQVTSKQGTGAGQQQEEEAKRRREKQTRSTISTTTKMETPTLRAATWLR